MHVRWWKSIRWQLALFSALLTLLAISALALTAILVINHYYGAEQKSRLHQWTSSQAREKARALMQEAETNPKDHLTQVAQDVLDLQAETDISQEVDTEQPPLIFVFNRSGSPVYAFPHLSDGKGDLRPSITITSMAQRILSPQPTSTKTVKALSPSEATKAREKAQAIIHSAQDRVFFYLQVRNPSLQQQDIDYLRQKLQRVLDQSNHPVVDGELGHNDAVGYGQPFSIRPLLKGKTLIGAIIVTIPVEHVPSLISSVGTSVLVASGIVAFMAALIAILFSQTITRPLMRLTQATRAITKGNYSTQVSVNAPGELGELSHNFNEMAVQLQQDVEELRRQELWRRELIMNVTHDLATPLTAIAGLGEALVDGVNQSREDYEATGRVIVRETLRLRRLVQDLHIMGKLEAGALEPKKKTLRLAALVDEVLAVLATEFERHQVEPNNTIAYTLPVVQADPDMLTRIFSNLCNNSLRHTPPGGSVIISASVRSNELEVSVTDTGEGIPEDALPRVFERFYRADGARQSSKGGSGLGLAIVQAIIDAHGGTIHAENAPGGGARIIFTLPLPTKNQDLDADAPTLPLRKLSRAYMKQRRAEEE